ncbi:MAG: hypothetical protein JWM80_5624 [Cyanobacteria bacterium RYN_339]|nr:hypothetical protein [Cyanobacteria bacterium RYN_339]
MTLSTAAKPPLSPGPVLWAGLALEAGIRAYVRLTGRRAPIAAHQWLAGPVGLPGRGGQSYYDDHAAAAQLRLVWNDPSAGLLPDFLALAGPDFDPLAIDPRVRAFYEHTAAYNLDAWSRWSWPFGALAWILIALVSRRVDQMNLPLSPLDTSAGMTSEVIKLETADGSPAAYRGWFRRLRESGRSIYAGFYTIAIPPRFGAPCVKVVFPLPYGSATVLLRPEAKRDGSLLLVSRGLRFGDPGFYRVLQQDETTLVARHVPAMHETIHVYIDTAGEMRTDHVFSFWSIPMLQLRYKITPKALVEPSA